MFDDPIKSPVDIAGARVKSGSPIDRLPTAEEAVEREGHELDSEDNRRLHGRLMSFHVRELDRQQLNRIEQAEDEDFYDNEQWDALDKATLEERGQVALVYNVISSTVNWVLGTEKRARTDFKVLPRRKDASKPAERKSQLLKYLSDVNRAGYARSRAFEDAVKVGIGWLECGVQDDDDGEPVYDRYESWRNVMWDSASTERDIEDGRYLSRNKHTDLDIAVAIFPDRSDVLVESAVAADDFLNDYVHGDSAMDSIEDGLDTIGGRADDIYEGRRQRVRLIEMWFRKPTKVKRLRRGEFSGEIFDPENPRHVDAVQHRESIVVDKTMMRMHVAIMTTKALLYVSETPFRHNRFPFTPIWCYRRGRDNMPYGMIRGMKGIQRDINKRASKALHILSTNKVIMDEGAVDDLEEFKEEVSRPDAVLIKKKGYDLTLNAERELAAPHLELMSRSIAMIQQQSGVTDENLGRRTNASSGIAIGRRQDQGALATAGIFDNLRYACQVHGEKNLSLVEQYFTERKAFRITNLRGAPDYIEINDGLPENDIVRTKADYVISEDDWRDSMRQAQVSELMALMAQLAPVNPQIAVVMLDLIVEMMDVPQREELVKRIRQVTGMRDPDAEEPTPEEIAKEQAAAEQAQLQKRALLAGIEDKEAGAASKRAAALRSEAEAQRALHALSGQSVETQRKALETALQMISVPAAVPVADGVLHEAGFKSRTENEEDAAVEQKAASLEQAALQAAQQTQQPQAAPPRGAGPMPTGAMP